MKQFDKQQPQDVGTRTQAPVSTERDLRYILTQKCNYNCSFCHKEGCDGSEKELLNSDDYLYLYDVIKDTIPLHGVTLSGGEPLLKKQIEKIIEPLKEKGAFVSMVTNGCLIDKNINKLGSLDRINISLHTLQQEIYETIIGKNISIEHILSNILLMKNKYPHVDLRINSTLLKSYFDSPIYIEKILDFITDHSITLKYLELSPKTDHRFVPNSSIIPFLEKKGFTLQANSTICKDENTYVLGGAKVCLRQCACDFTKAHGGDQNFCKQNNDIVVSPDGMVSSCILDTKKLDLYPAIKEKDDKEIIKKIMTLQDPNFRYACCLNK